MLLEIKFKGLIKWNENSKSDSKATFILGTYHSQLYIFLIFPLYIILFPKMYVSSKWGYEQFQVSILYIV